MIYERFDLTETEAKSLPTWIICDSNAYIAVIIISYIAVAEQN